METLFGDDFDWDALLGGLGEQWSLQRHGFNIKRYPPRSALQWATECVSLLREKNGIRADDVEWLERRCSPSAPPTQSRNLGLRRNRRQFSFEYCASRRAHAGQVCIDTFTDAVRFSAPMEPH